METRHFLRSITTHQLPKNVLQTDLHLIQLAEELFSSTSRSLGRILYSFHFRSIYVCQNRHFFVTESGHFGIGPSAFKAGDDVHIVFRADVPLITRRHHSVTGLAGQAYIEGFM